MHLFTSEHQNNLQRNVLKLVFMESIKDNCFYIPEEKTHRVF